MYMIMPFENKHLFASANSLKKFSVNISFQAECKYEKDV